MRTYENWETWDMDALINNLRQWQKDTKMMHPKTVEMYDQKGRSTGIEERERTCRYLL